MKRFPGDPDLSGPAVLSALREHGKKMHFAKLCALLGVRGLTSQGDLLRVLATLFDLGLIVADRPDFEGYDSDATIALSGSVRELAHVLGLSIRDLVERDPRRSAMFEPFFGRPLDLQGKEAADIFVLMPFRPELAPIYEDHVKRVAKRRNLTVKRADDFFTAHDVMKDVWNGICNAKVVIADCTDRNPNVFYEIGLAHTVGKSVVLITQNSGDVPFDLRSIRFIHYQYTPPGMKAFESALEQTIQRSIDASP